MLQAVSCPRLSSVTALANVNRSNQSEILQHIIDLIQNIENRITIAWIPGHCNIKDNDTADKLAKTALTHGEVDIPVASDKDIYNKIDEFINDKWQNHWGESKTGLFYKT